MDRHRYGSLEEALQAVEARGRALQRSAGARPIDLRTRRFEPVQQVVARLEIAGPARLRAGLDVRGDGSSEGYVGRWHRRVVEQRTGESPYQALRRVLTPGEGSGR